MTKKIKYSLDVSTDPQKLAEAVEHYVSQGGVINVIAEGESRETEASRAAREADPEAERCAKVFAQRPGGQGCWRCCAAVFAADEPEGD
jgi:hypothetical protein